MAENLARANNVSMRYEGASHDILEAVNVSISPHSFQFLTGPSGSGKSTLLRLFHRTLLPTEGSVELFGIDAAKLTGADLLSCRHRIGVVSQRLPLLDHLTVFQNVALPFRIKGVDESGYRREAIDLLKWVGLGEHLDAYPPTLSSGEKQRAAIARAVITRPHLLLADEPTGSVDPAAARRLLRLFIELNRLGTAVVVATHDLTLMNQYDARRLILSNRRLHTYE